MKRLIAVVLFCACSSEGEQPVPEPPRARDPAHCTFETPPVRAERPPIAPGKIRAAVVSAILPLPIGSPLGGYGARLRGFAQAIATDARARRFTSGFVPSVGMHDAPHADVLAIEAAGETFVLVRVDAPYVTENSLFELERAASPDGALRGRIMLTASHSHAGYGSWQPTFTLMVGSDKPRRDAAERVVGAIAGAVKQALSKLEPARLGIAVDSSFDPKNTVSRDRREENNALPGGKGKDPIVWALRVDRADGSPLAAVVDLAIHGTVGGERNPLASTDAPGAIARALTSELGYPVLHVQGAAGDVSPADPKGRNKCPDAARCLDMPMLEVLGARAAALVGPLVKGIKTGDQAALEVVTRTFYTGRNAKVHRPDGTVLEYAPADDGYEPDGKILEGGKVVTPIDEFNTEGGAGLCGGTAASGSFSPIPGTAGMGPYASCIDVTRGKNIMFSFFEVPADVPVPLCDTIRATTTAVRISGTPSGDYLILGVPGEPTAPFAAYLRSRSPAGARTLLVGYTDEYAGYMLTAEDWLAGGYEPGTNIWGPLEGEVIMDGLLDAAKLAWTPALEDPEKGSSRFVDYVYPPSPALQLTVTSDHGTVASTLPEGMWWPDALNAAPGGSVARAVGVARFAWNGGDPGVDAPRVSIEHESGGVFAPIATAEHGAVVLTYTPDPLKAALPTRHVYGATWQPVPAKPFSFAAPNAAFSLPLGRYRFHVEGFAQSGSGRVPYSILSEPFDVTPAPLASGSSASATTIKALLGSAPGMRALRETDSDSDIALPGPWTVEVTMSDDTKKTITVTPDAKGTATVDLSGAKSVDVRDPFGNGGVLAVTP